MLKRFKERSYELENIDRGSYTRDEYNACIGELQRVNRWLGDARALRRTLLSDIESQGLDEFSILDVGAGSGELLRVTGHWARSLNKRARLTGLELNEMSALALLKQSAEFPEINSVRGTGFQLPFTDGQFDYVISSLFTHHFTDTDVVRLLREMARVASREIYIIDLHRHPIAYFLYTTAGKLILHNRLLREDGALSIRRSFKRGELLALSAQAGLTEARVERRFPYRLVLRASAANKERDSLGTRPRMARASDRAA